MTTVGTDYLATLGKTQSSSTTTKSGSNEIDQSAFLKLLSAQLQSQDPTDPVDNSQMLSQLAQFSSVAGISEMNESLKTLVSQMGGGRVSDAANWIGRAALVDSDVATPLSDGSYAGEITLPDDATGVQINLIDASGAVVHTETLGEQDKGTIAFQWDGKDADGNVAANGPLQVVVNAVGTDGSIDATVNSWTMINAVQSPSSGSSTQLVTPLGLISPDDALRLG